MIYREAKPVSNTHTSLVSKGADEEGGRSAGSPSC